MGGSKIKIYIFFFGGGGGGVWPSPCDSPIIHRRLANSRMAPKTPKSWKTPKKNHRNRRRRKMCHCSTILAIRPLTRGLHDIQKRVFWIVTKRQTDTQTDMATLWLNRPSAVGRFSENQLQLYIIKFIEKAFWIFKIYMKKKLGFVIILLLNNIQLFFIALIAPKRSANAGGLHSVRTV